MMYNILKVTRNELASINLVSGTRLVVDETALVYNRVVFDLVSDGIYLTVFIPILVNFHLSV